MRFFLSLLAVLIILQMAYTILAQKKHKKHKNWNTIKNDKEKMASLRGQEAPPTAAGFLSIPLDPESFFTPPQILVYRGFSAETHHVETEDGYILEIHRIAPRSKGQRVVYFQHGLFESSGTWLINPSNKSLPCLLADLGYDVWLGNARGNYYSRGHVRLHTDDPEYWKYGWDEVGKFDIPAVIKYILKISRQPKISFVGHSMGGGVFYIAMITHPELNDKIDMMIGLAPSTSFRNTGTPLRYFFPFVKQLQALFGPFFARRAMLDNRGPVRRWMRLLCEQNFFQARICLGILNALVLRVDFTNLDLNLAPMIHSNIMAGASANFVAQFAQNSNAGQVFQAYDHGWMGNLLRYGQFHPMQYNLTQVTAPTYIFYGTKDDVVTPKDVEWMMSQLGNLQYYHRIEGYTHKDFLWGYDAKEKFCDQVITLLHSA